MQHFASRTFGLHQLCQPGFVGVRPNGSAQSVQECREIVRKAGRRPVVALINIAEMARASEVRSTGVEFVYGKHPIWRTAQVRSRTSGNAL